MKFAIITFGCKVNQYESNMMKESMLSSNFLFTESISEADIIIINTCTVTNTADNKCLKMVRHIKREHPEKILAVAGCSTQNNPSTYESLGINILIGNKDKSKIAEFITNYINTNEDYTKFYEERNLEFEDMVIEDFNHIRAFIKIEDGCDNFCSYCIIPYVRGSVRSKDFDVVLKEANSLVEKRHKEIVLTGIHTGRYENNGHDLVDLIEALSKIEGLMRIRISSIEITELNDKFMDMLRNNPKVCDHLHVPLQSGSDDVLKLMNRKYDLAYFEEKIKLIRSIRPDISLSTDIIVGHPGETEENFNECLEFSRKINFSKIHVFPYSKREGTRAAKMPNQVDGGIKKMRVAKLIELSNELEESYYNKFIGKSVDVLIEESNGKESVGHTSNYLKVTLNESLSVGQIYKRIL